MRVILQRCAIIGIACCWSLAAIADDSVNFAGKTVHFIAGFEAGGPYDSYTRLIAQHIGAHLAGNPITVVDNMPGAGSVTATNYLYNVAPRDGTAMGIMSQTIGIGQLLQNVPGIRYDVRNMTWIGRITPNVEVAFTWYKSNFRTIEDTKNQQVIAAGTGPTSSSVVFPRLMNALVGTQFKLVRGYTGPASAFLALENGEVGTISEIWSGLKAEHADLLRDKKTIVYLQYTTQRYRELSDVPAVVELAHNQEQAQILDLFASGGDLATSLVAPPDVPPNVTAALRKAFMDTMHDPSLIDEVRTASIEVDPLPGDEVQKIAGSIFSIDKNVVARAKEISERLE